MKKLIKFGNYVVESGIKPKENNGLGRKPKYPWSIMAIGDSFLLEPVDKCKEAITRSKMWSLAKNAGIKVSVRRDNDGLRVFRVK